MANYFDEWLAAHYGTTPPPSTRLGPQGTPSMYQFEGLGPEAIPTPQQYAQAQAEGQALRSPPVGPDGLFPMSYGPEVMKRLEHMQKYPHQYEDSGFRGFEVPPFTVDQALQARRDLEAEPWKEQPWQPPTQASYGVDGSWPIPHRGPPPIEPRFEGAVSGPWLEEDSSWWIDDKAPRLHYSEQDPSALAVERLAHMEKYPWQYGMGERPQAPAQQVPQMPQGQEDALRQQLEAMQFNQYPEMQARGPDESFPSDIAPQDYAQIRDMTARAYMEPEPAPGGSFAFEWDEPAPQPLVDLDREAMAMASQGRRTPAVLDAPKTEPVRYHDMPDPARAYLYGAPADHPLSREQMVDAPRRQQAEEWMAAYGKPELPGGQSLAQLQREMDHRDYGLYETMYKDYDRGVQEQLASLYGPGEQHVELPRPDEIEIGGAPVGSPSVPRGDDRPFAYPDLDLPEATPEPPVSIPPMAATPQDFMELDAYGGTTARFTPEVGEQLEAMLLSSQMAGVPIEISGRLAGARTPEMTAELQRRYDAGESKWAPDPTGGHTEAGGYRAVDLMVGDSPDTPQYQWLKDHGSSFGFRPAHRIRDEGTHWHHWAYDPGLVSSTGEAPALAAQGAAAPSPSVGAPLYGNAVPTAPDMAAQSPATPLSAQTGGAPADMGLDLAPIPGRMSELSGKDRLYAQLMGDPDVPMEKVEELAAIAEAPLPSMLGSIEAGMAQERALGLDRGDIIASPEASPGGAWPEGIMGEVNRTLAHQQYLDQRMKPYELAGISPPAELASQVAAADRRAESIRKGAQQWDRDIRERVRRLRVIANQLSIDKGIGRRSEFTNQRTQDAQSLFESLPNVETGRAAPQERLSKRGGLEPKRFREAVAAMDREISELTRNLPLNSGLRSELETLNRNIQRTPSPDERAPREVARILESDAYPGQARSPRAKLRRFSDVYELNNILDRYEAWMDRVEAVSRKVKPRRSRSKRLARQTRINISKRK